MRNLKSEIVVGTTILDSSLRCASSRMTEDKGASFGMTGDEGAVYSMTEEEGNFVQSDRLDLLFSSKTPCASMSTEPSGQGGDTRHIGASRIANA